MAIVLNPSKRAVSLKLEDGTTETGRTKLVSVAIGKLKQTQDFSTTKAQIFAIADALAPCLGKVINNVTATTTDTIEDDD